MPSNAYAEYRKNLKDVHSLVLAHRRASVAKPGKRALGHFTRGGLLLLCAAWERYTESVIEASAEFLTSYLPGVASLPPNARQKTRDHANSNKTAWRSSDLNTDAWKSIYLEGLKSRIINLNTQKHKFLQPIFDDYLDLADIASAWTLGKGPIDAFVELRGEVAHRGGQSTYIRFGRLTDAEEVVIRYVIETDNYLSDCLRLLVTPNRRPWNRVL